MEKIVRKFKKTLDHYNMVSPGEKVLVSVSGGPDSVALLFLLNELKKELNLKLYIAHLNHMTRSKDSDEDALFVSRLGERLELKTFIEAIDVRKQQETFKKSLQETARILRYRFLNRVLEKAGGNKIALGHTADDHTETFFMNLLRGSGMKGLTGIPPARDHIIRPLIECFHSETKAFLRKRGLPFRSDLSNNDHSYLRNRIRADLIPKLQAEYNRNIQTNIVETAKIIGDDEAFLSTCTEKSFDRCFLSGKKGSELSLSIEKIQKENIALQKRLARKAISFINDHLRGVTTKHIHNIVEMISNPTIGKELHLPDHLLVICGLAKLDFIRKPKNRNSIPTDKPLKTALNISGVTESAGVKFITKLCLPEDWESYHCPSNQAFLDFDKTGDLIYTRFFLPGDRFVPLGMTGKKKLKSFFIDKKIPREQRKKTPILTTYKDDIIWVFGERISNSFRVTSETKKILLIEGIPMNNTLLRGFG